MIILGVGFEDIFHIWRGERVTEVSEVGEGPSGLPLGGELVGVWGVDAGEAAAEGDAEDAGGGAEGEEGGHDGIDLEIEEGNGEAGFERARGGASEELAVGEEADGGAAFGFVHVMGGDEDGRAVVGEFVEEIPDLLTVDGIEAGGWFVEEEDGWLVEEGGGDGEELFEATGEGAGEGESMGGEIDGFEEELDAGRDLGRGDAVSGGEEAEIFEDGEIVIEAKFLGDVAEERANLGAMEPGIEASDGGGTGGGFGEAGEHLDGGGFSGAVGAEEAEDFVGGDLEGEAIDGGERAERFLEMTEDNDGLGHGQGNEISKRGRSATVPEWR